ncbi:GntP family permease [Thermobrachium celere]|uniref:GntP family permease n=1 Tax=Thermobrachium celere TaxID=53422 RepID=UPI0019432513|nr:GntP family permease [Thermobrachium celere]GFR36032.1 citrate transporter [Thermobrachium celere]
MLGVIGIILSLALLMYLAYRGITVLVLAPLLALLAALFTGGTPLMATYTEVFMKNLANYVKLYFPIFMLGALFGKVMEDSGSAKAIAHYIANKLGKEKAIMAVVLSCAILTYGGVSLFVVAFAVYPVAAHLFKEAGIPKRLIPGAIALGSFTFTMTALPGTPQIQNAIPMPFFGTNAYAAPILGIVAAIIMAGLGIWWLQTRAKKAMAEGEGYGYHPNESFTEIDESKLPSFWVALVPIILVLVINFILSKYYFPRINADYLAQEPYKTSLKSVAGIWSLIIALVIAIITAFVIHRNRIDNILKTLNNGIFGSFLPILNTASEVGYGNVIASLASFVIIKNAILGISSNPLISEAISVNILAGITGSASGGMSIALGALGKQYMEMATQMGINPEALHRIATIACGGLDSLPHNGAVVTLLGICGMTHKESYKDIGMVSVVIPLIALVVALILASFGIV